MAKVLVGVEFVEMRYRWVHQETGQVLPRDSWTDKGPEWVLEAAEIYRTEFHPVNREEHGCEPALTVVD